MTYKWQDGTLVLGPGQFAYDTPKIGRNQQMLGMGDAIIAGVTCLQVRGGVIKRVLMSPQAHVVTTSEEMVTRGCRATGRTEDSYEIGIGTATYQEWCCPKEAQFQIQPKHLLLGALIGLAGFGIGRWYGKKI